LGNGNGNGTANGWTEKQSQQFATPTHKPHGHALKKQPQNPGKAHPHPKDPTPGSRESREKQKPPRQWHKKPFCAASAVDSELSSRRRPPPNDIYFIRHFRLADVSKHPLPSYFLFA